jgi:hypothetical protein
MLVLGDWFMSVFLFMCWWAALWHVGSNCGGVWLNAQITLMCSS